MKSQHSKGYGRILELKSQFQELPPIEAYKQLIFNLFADIDSLYQLTDKKLVVQIYGADNDKFTTICLVTLDILPAIEMLYFKNSNEERVRFNRSFIKTLDRMNLYETVFYKEFKVLLKDGLKTGVY